MGKIGVIGGNGMDLQAKDGIALILPSFISILDKLARRSVKISSFSSRATTPFESTRRLVHGVISLSRVMMKD